MSKNPDVIIATPGRLLHLLVEMSMELSQVQICCFDEADRLFELGFELQLTNILESLSPQRQVMLFSATLPKSLIGFAKAGLHDPILLRLDLDTKISPDLDSSFLLVKSKDKLSLLLHLINDLLVANEQTILFCSTRYTVDMIYTLLELLFIGRSTYIYGLLDPEARNENLNKLN